MKRDTIAAISTALFPAGIAVIRISGQDSIKITDSIFKGRMPLKEASSYSINYGTIQNEGDIIDQVVVGVMRGPHSYTGEDVCEINCHGSLFIQKRILNILIQRGARPAGPGEFTMRAFLNGRMDLSQAESVMDVIASENETALRISLDHLSGEFSALVNKIRQNILHEIAFIESALDDSEHISLEGYPDRLLGVLSGWRSDIDRLIKTYETAFVIKKGIDCAIIGGVNVGKSSLLNALCNTDRAIVTDIPGTTRDAIEQHISIGSISLNIIDTAGIRETDNEIENIGIGISKKYMESADLILMVVDGSLPISEKDVALIKQIKNKKNIILINKSDLLSKVCAEDIRKHTDACIINISAKTLFGLDRIVSEIENMFLKKGFQPGVDAVVTSERHLRLLQEAAVSLEKVSGAIDAGMTEEIFTVDLTDAYESLGKIMGLSIGDDVINEIFSKFCIGK